MRALELLAPAKNLECGIAAIDHGADAVYIGAQRFGARASAGNSVEDIAQLGRYAHQFGVKVYVTVNTIIYEDELADTAALLQQLADIHVDAVLVQDMALLTVCPSSLVLHASTQTDNRDAEKVAWLKQQGFQRVVLARETSIKEIRSIHEAVPDVELEAFVHGALCVSYSGLCYASQHCFGRSANRGECAQFCRMKFDLLDADGKMVEQQRYLLSLKDLNLSNQLEELADAGVTSFKIEGRLKGLSYVKNVTAAYSTLLNQLVTRYPDRYQRASRGICRYTFKPDLRKTFNRGYTTYFAGGRQPDIASFDTPKAIGEFVGTVKEIRDRLSFTVAGTASFVNGDGLCFINEQQELVGFRVNRVVGNRLFLPPQKNTPEQKSPLSSLRPGIRLYRNNDQAFELLLSHPSAERKIPVRMMLKTTANGFSLMVEDVEVSMSLEHQRAEKPQRDNIIRQLSKLGGTPYECSEVLLPDDFDYFIPSSQLAELRRLAIAKFSETAQQRIASGVASQSVQPSDVQKNLSLVSSLSSRHSSLTSYARTYFYNIANSRARAFYEQQGLKNAEPAFELHTSPRIAKQKSSNTCALIMQCRHCLRYSLGFCVKNGGRKPQWCEPLQLRLADGRCFPVEFDCRHCQMNIYAESH